VPATVVDLRQPPAAHHDEDAAPRQLHPEEQAEQVTPNAPRAQSARDALAGRGTGARRR
jgi:hypothetical protein